MPVKIAIIGGGAKAAAIAARSHCIELARKEKGSKSIPPAPEITIFEQRAIGSGWTGAAGYTDGAQRLCTAIERDLGFPYTSKHPKLDELMLKHFSWHSFRQSEKTYQRWIDEGRKPPRHSLFSRYLKWATTASECDVVIAEVKGCKAHEGKWRIKIQGKEDSRGRFYREEFDGLVITGPGPANRITRTGSPRNFFTGQDFWSRLGEVRRCLKQLAKDTEAEIAIIGAGGTAAAILAWLIRNGQQDRIIRLVADQPAFFTRGDSVFENSLFNDDTAWGDLSNETRIAFTTRLNRGVVWQSVMSQLEEATGLRFVEGMAKSVSFGNTIKVLVEPTAKDKMKFHLQPGMVIDASGFDATWFSRLLEPNNFPEGTPRDLRKWIAERVDASLQISDPALGLPNIHVPGLADLQGPGFGSLMSLGGMAQRVLMGYWDP
ncbi:SidA/IucD/PvdA family monooxygenase [Pseudoxanthomonas sp.]|uniref:SidA/IucD/PvdA family monooxygenase n=1 Tax=Pseudoxanthomonas sp. TaxID=1871049 RepID=UPI002FE365AD